MTAGHSLGEGSLRSRTATAATDRTFGARLAVATDRFSTGRVAALAELDDADGLRLAARAAKAEVLADLPAVLERLADRLVERGVHVCWACDAAEANAYIAGVAKSHGARVVVKSKSMASEETGLNAALEATGARVVETDLGEWIIQLAGEAPSHIIVPAIHRDRNQIADVLRRVQGGERLAAIPEELASFARARLREEFLRADMGVSGANFGVAESGSIVLVTNEGNGRMVTSLPRVHVAILGMERVVATWAQLDLMVALLARSATGQPLTTYTNVISGPRGEGEADGPEELHVVILDNGRSEILGTEFHEILACIRCGACLNVCPVYRQVGGHAYGWVYSGPIGAVITPLLAAGQPGAAEVANASTLCGACMDACPVAIPIQDLLLGLRRRKASHAGRLERTAWTAWAAAWSRPGRYGTSLRAAALGRVLLPIVDRAPSVTRWGAGRTVPRPAATSFRERWRRGNV